MQKKHTSIFLKNIAATGGGASQTQLSAAGERIPSLAKPFCRELFLMEVATCLQMSSNCIVAQGEAAMHPTKLLVFFYNYYSL